jgi:hypothetical protein
MSTLNLTIPLTIPQLAQMLRQQFSVVERQKLVELIQEPENFEDEEVSTADSLRLAIGELNQYKRGEINLPTLEAFLDELQG